jgi:hypothetical protein
LIRCGDTVPGCWLTGWDENDCLLCPMRLMFPRPGNWPRCRMLSWRRGWLRRSARAAGFFHVVAASVVGQSI